MRKITSLFLLTVSLVSCKLNNMSINVEEPSAVTISNAIKRVGIINRSVPSEEAKASNTVHDVLSGESMTMIKEGGVECIKGLKDALMENKRFDQVVVLDSLKFKTPASGIFPTQLSWDQVTAICKKNNVAALFVLEFFDTELKVTPTSVPVNVSNPLALVSSLNAQANITTLVKTGWRIYDPASRTIIDEFPLTQNMTFNGGTANPLATADALIKRKDYVKQTANKAGHIYADRIIPVWINVGREYYVKGSDNFKIAKRKARSGNWDGAAELWQKEINNPKNKIAGRALFNMAVSNEMNGNLDKAIEMAQKSYEDHNNKHALRYLSILRSRKADDKLLDVQQTQ